MIATDMTTNITTSKLLRLDYNENSLGMSERAKQAVIDALDGSFRYPDAQRTKLIAKIAALQGVANDQVVLGNGSIENIRAVVHMLQDKALKTGKKFQLIVPDPTFACAELHARSIGVHVTKVPLTANNYDLDFENLQRAAEQFDGISLFYISNPNNPTGIITATDKLKHWVQSAPANHYFLIDEAYLGYVTDPSFESAIEWVKQKLSDNLIVVSTFSKLYALAGMRVGYAISSPHTALEIKAVMSTDNTNISGAIAAMATLDDKDFLDLSLRTNNQSKQMVEAVLDELGLRYLPSQTNFVFHEIKGDAKTYMARMRDHGIAVGREFLPIKGFSRITLGTPDEMEVFVKALKSFRAKGWI